MVSKKETLKNSKKSVESEEEEVAESSFTKEEEGFGTESTATTEAPEASTPKKEKKEKKSKIPPTPEEADKQAAKKEKKPKAPEPAPEPETPKEFNVEEGTFYERIVSPIKMTVWRDDKKVTGRANRIAVLEDINGEKMRIEGNTIIRRLCQVIANQYIPNARTAEFWQMEEKELSEAMTKLLTDAQEKQALQPVKLMHDATGTIYGASTESHKQVPWSQIKTIIEEAIQATYGNVDVIPPQNPNIYRWNYRLPIENEHVSSWVNVERGSNLARGRAAISLSARFRTDQNDFGGAPPCQNWAGVWGPVAEFFDVKLERLGELKYPAELSQLSARHVHMKGTFSDNGASVEELKASLDALRKGAIAVNELIEQSIREPLSFDEMVAIIKAYDEKVGIPVYVKEAIIQRAKKQGSETVFAFSQAVSWIRTHEDLKATKKDKELRSLTQKLENIAGEIYSLSPMIHAFHEKIGVITFEELIELPKKKSNQPAPEAPAEEIKTPAAPEATAKSA